MRTQTELEERARDAAYDKHRARLDAKLESKNAEHLRSRVVMTERNVVKFTQAVKEWRDQYKKIRPNHWPMSYIKLQGLTDSVIAAVALKVAVGVCSTNHTPTRTSVLMSVGEALEFEAAAAHLHSVRPAVWRWLKDKGSLDAATASRARQTTAQAMVWGGTDWVPWGKSGQVHVGHAMIDLIERTTGLLRTEKIRKAHGNHFRMVHVVVMTPKAAEWLADFDARDAWGRATLYPMIEQPLSWTNPEDGGYLTVRMPFAKSESIEWFRNQHMRDLDVVYGAMNAVQGTAYVINEDAMVALQETWMAGIRVKGIPELDDIVTPPRPEGLEKDDPVLQRWQRDYAIARNHNMKATGKRIGVKTSIAAAKQFQRDVMYFPTTLDFRGRMYSAPAVLSPQGADYSKNLLAYAEEKKLTSQDQWDWLKIHGANVYGNDKLPFSERLAWVDSNLELIEAVAADPMSCREWTQVDKPLGFLAFCVDYVHALETERSRLPVAMDGSCSGLQHYSAMLRDPEGARAVNLEPSEVVNDIYGEVAKRLVSIVEREAGGSDSDAAMAAQWAKSGLLDRSLCKQPTMTTPYGVTASGIKGQINDQLTKLRLQKGSLPFEDQGGMLPAAYLGPKMAEAIRGVAPLAMEAMSVLRRVATALAKDDRQASWVVPFTNFEVQQGYLAYRRRKVITRLHGAVKGIWIRDEDDMKKVAMGKAKASIAPNFIHSLDAAHLMMTVNAMEAGAESPTYYSMVHDSFATHAADAPRMARVLREQFVRLYAETDIMGDFIAEQEKKGLSRTAQQSWPTALPQGGFDVCRILESKYFFA